MGYDRWFISIPVSRVLHPPRLTPSRLVATSLIAFSNYRPPSLPTILLPPFQIDKKIESPYRGNEFQKFDPFISSHFFFPLPFLSLLLFFFSSPLYFIFRFCFFFLFSFFFFSYPFENYSRVPNCRSYITANGNVACTIRIIGILYVYSLVSKARLPLALALIA